MTDPDSPNGSASKIRDGIDTARDKASHAYETARDKAGEAVDASRDRARDAARQTAETIDSNPLGVIVGGLALGALVAAVIPRSEREKELLAPVGKRVGATAAAALAAAKEAGKAELGELGLTRSAAKDQVKTLFDGLIKTASTASTAAAKAGKEEVKTN